MTTAGNDFGTAAIGPHLLDDADRGVDDDHEGDDDGVGEVTSGDGEHAGRQQDPDQGVAQLHADARPHRDATALADLVAPVLLAPLLDLGR